MEGIEDTIINVLSGLNNPTVDEVRQVIKSRLAPLDRHSTFFVLLNLTNKLDDLDNNDVIKKAIDLEYKEFLQNGNNHHDPAQEYNNDQEHPI